MEGSNIFIYGLSLAGMVLGIVQAAKKIGIRDKFSVILALILGPVLMATFTASEMLPAFRPWVQSVVVGLGASLSAMGFYSISKGDQNK